MASTGKSTASLPFRPIEDRAKLEAVMNAVSEYDLASSPAWSELDALSSRTFLDGHEAVPEGVFADDSKFSAVGTVYVSLNYGDKSEESITSSDAFPARIEGHFEGRGKKLKAVIDSFSVDTSSFYE